MELSTDFFDRFPRIEFVWTSGLRRGRRAGARHADHATARHRRTIAPRLVLSVTAASSLPQEPRRTARRTARCGWRAAPSSAQNGVRWLAPAWATSLDFWQSRARSLRMVSTECDCMAWFAANRNLLEEQANLDQPNFQAFYGPDLHFDFFVIQCIIYTFCNTHFIIHIVHIVFCERLWSSKFDTFEFILLIFQIKYWF